MGKVDFNELIIEALRTEYEKGRADAIAEIQESAKWSEEDRKMSEAITNGIIHLELEDCWDYMYTTNGNSIAIFRVKNWLNSLKDRVQRVEWTDEELDKAKKEAWNNTLDKMEYNSGSPTFDDGWTAAIRFLKSNIKS